MEETKGQKNESQKSWKWIAECVHRLCKYIPVATEGANSELVDCMGFLGLVALGLSESQSMRV